MNGKKPARAFVDGLPKPRIGKESRKGKDNTETNRCGLSRSLLTRWRKEYKCGLLGEPAVPSFTAVAIADDRVPSSATSVADPVEITLHDQQNCRLGLCDRPD